MQKHTPLSNSTRTNRRHRANFARAAVFAEFGRHARALDWDDFADRKSGEVPRPTPKAWVR